MLLGVKFGYWITSCCVLPWRKLFPYYSLVACSSSSLLSPFLDSMSISVVLVPVMLRQACWSHYMGEHLIFLGNTVSNKFPVPHCLQSFCLRKRNYVVDVAFGTIVF